jgi:hypothetical protein
MVAFSHKELDGATADLAVLNISDIDVFWVEQHRD